MQKCPHCQTVFHVQVKFCPVCGKKIDGTGMINESENDIVSENFINSKCAWLKNFLNQKPIKNEELIFEAQVCYVNDIEMTARFFITNFRCGVVEKSFDFYFYNTIWMIRNSELDFSEEILTVSVADDTYIESLEKDRKYVIKYSDFGDAERVNYYLWNIRYNLSSNKVDDYFDKAFEKLQQGCAEKAIDLLYKASELDPMTGINDSLLVRTLVAAGREAEAMSFIAKRWSILVWLAPEYIISELIWYRWHKGAMRCLPFDKSYQKGVLASELIYAANMRGQNKEEAFVNCLRDIVLEHDVSGESLFRVILNFDKLSKKENIQCIQASLKDIWAKVWGQFAELSKEREPDFEANRAMDFLRNIVEFHKEPSLEKKLSLLKNWEDFSGEKEAYLLQEDFRSLVGSNVDRKIIDKPEHWSAQVAFDLETDLWESMANLGELKHKIYELFAKRRIEAISLEELSNYLCEIKEHPAIPYLSSVEPVTSMYIALLEAELAIDLAKPEKAVAILQYWKEKNEQIIGNYSEPYLWYANEIIQVYKAVTFRSSYLLKRSLKNMPNQHPFNWIFHWANRYVDIHNIEKKGENSTFAANSLQELSGLLENLLTFPQIAGLVEQNIKECKRQINQDIETLNCVPEDISKLPVEMQNRQKVRIALAGETSSGKSTFLNRLFSTNVFFATQEEATGLPTEVHYDKKMRIEVWDKNNQLAQTYPVPDSWLADDGVHFNEEHLPLFQTVLAELTKVGSSFAKEGGGSSYMRHCLCLPM